MCLSLSLFSNPVCMVVLMKEYSSTVFVVISGTSRSNVCLFLFVPDLYFLILHYYTGCYPAVISLLLLVFY